jgi:hypothetical protein
VNIKASTMRMQNFHRFSLNAVGLEPPLSKSRTRAPGLSPTRDTIWGAQGFRVRLTDGLARTKMTPTFAPTARRSLPNTPTRFISCGSGTSVGGYQETSAM